MPQKCQCIAQTDGAPTERQEMWKRIFPPDGKVPVIGKVYPGENPYCLIDLDRVTLEQRNAIVREMAAKWKSPESEVAKDIAAIGAPVSIKEVTVEFCSLHQDNKKKGDAFMPRRKTEKVNPVSPAAPAGTGDTTKSTTTAIAAGTAITPPAAEKNQSAPPSPRVIKTVKQLLPHKLTDEEFRVRSKQLSATFDSIVQELARQKRIKDELKAAISALVSKQAELAKAVQSGEEPALTEVSIIIAGDNTVVQEVRKDTGEIISSRPPTDFERQAPLLASEEDIFGERK